MLLASSSTKPGATSNKSIQHRCKRKHNRGQLSILSAKISGRFDESADQVKKLVERDRGEVKQFGDIGGSLTAEFDEGTDEQPSTSNGNNSSTTATSRSTPVAKGFVNSSPAATPFGASRSPSGTSPFGEGAPKRAASFMEPEGLRPDMPMPKPDTEAWWKKITLTQVVIVLSFTLIITSMLATFFVVLKSGGVRFNED